MAWNVLRRVWKVARSAVTSSERLVLLNLAEHCHKDGRSSWASVRTISAETSLTPRAVQKILLRLETKGFIVRDGYGPRGSVSYALVLAALPDSDREPGSQNRERGSQWGADHEPDSQGGEPGSATANVETRDREPRSPDPVRTPFESEENPDADARVDVHERQGPTIRFETWDERVEKEQRDREAVKARRTA